MTTADDKASEVAEKRYRHRGGMLAELGAEGFTEGAAWQREQPVEITDEMVERACIAFTCDSAEEWFELAATYRASIWSGMHVALEAALNGGKS
jgi:hypothetical protein